jgi:hypothetical protein
MMKKIYLILLAIPIVWCLGKGKSETTTSNWFGIFTFEKKIHILNFSKLKSKGKEAFTFCRSNDYNTDFCILIDLGMHSGVNRFFIWNFKKDTIESSCLVSHGCGNMPWGGDYSKDSVSVSNKDGSHCSSVGKYKLGERAFSNWGIHVKYLMYGLESTNSNALARQIVFHSWESIPDLEVYPYGTPEGWGCPAISNANMKVVDARLKASKKPVLMWIYK